MLLAVVALACATVWTTRASSAGPPAGQVLAWGNNGDSQLGPGRSAADPDAAAIELRSPAATAAAGGSHTLVVGSDGSLSAFGANFFGQLGNSVNVGGSTATPTSVGLPPGAGSVVQAAAGYDFSAALTTSGQVYEFGDNSAGQLGITANSGTMTANPTPTAVTLAGDSHPITQAVAGGAFVVARTSDDHLWSWGDNTDGQLGTPGSSGAPTNPTPQDITFTAVGHFVGLAAGANHALALTSSGQVFSWGDDHYGQLGRDPSENPAFTTDEYPQQILSFPPSAGPIVAIAAGGNHSLALDSGGQLYAWGDNHYGQLGTTANNGSDTPNQTPALVPMPAGAGAIVQISAGSDDTLVLTSTGRLYAFGDNSDGQLGNHVHTGAAVANPSPTVVAVPGDTTLEAVADGPVASHTLAVVAALGVASNALPAATLGAAYSAQAPASGGIGPYRWTASDLPGGLSISGSGAITGTPAQVGNYSPTLTVTDANGIAATATVALPVHAPATSASGSTTAGPPPPTTATSAPRVSILSLSLAGPGATIVARCAGAARQRCAGTISGSTVEHLLAGKPVSVTGAVAKPTRRAARTTRRLTVVSRQYTVKAGQTARIRMSLNRSGRRLLDVFYALPVTLSIAGGRTHSSRRVSFRYTVINAPIDFFWNYRRSYTFVGKLRASGLKPAWHVSLSCRGGGCPLRRTTIAIHHGAASATAALAGAHLRLGTVVQLTVSARNAVAEVLRFTIVSNRLPDTTALCQTPDERRPGLCHH